MVKRILPDKRSTSHKQPAKISLILEISIMPPLNDSEKIEILIDQIGRMTESITELRMSVEAERSALREELTETRSTIREEFAATRELIQSGFSELRAVSERQERNIRPPARMRARMEFAAIQTNSAFAD